MRNGRYQYFKRKINERTVPFYCGGEGIQKQNVFYLVKVK